MGRRARPKMGRPAFADDLPTIAAFRMLLCHDDGSLKKVRTTRCLECKVDEGEGHMRRRFKSRSLGWR